MHTAEKSLDMNPSCHRTGLGYNVTNAGQDTLFLVQPASIVSKIALQSDRAHLVSLIERPRYEIQHLEQRPLHMLLIATYHEIPVICISVQVRKRLAFLYCSRSLHERSTKVVGIEYRDSPGSLLLSYAGTQL